MVAYTLLPKDTVVQRVPELEPEMLGPTRLIIPVDRITVLRAILLVFRAALLHADARPPSPPPRPRSLARSYIIPFAKQHAPHLMYDVGVMPSRGSAINAATARGVKRASKSIFPLSEKRRGKEGRKEPRRGDN